MILTQNTLWKNAENSLLTLHDNDLLNPNSILINNIAPYIRSLEYYNQKAKKLKYFSEFFINKFDKLKSMQIEKARNELLSIHGIGKESADSILLYVLRKPIFIIDSYIKRLFTKIRLNSYEQYQEYFHKNLPLDYKIFNEFHALIVKAGKAKVDINSII